MNIASRGNSHPKGPLVNTASPIEMPANHLSHGVFLSLQVNSHNATKASVIKKVNSMSMRAWLPR